MPRAGDIRVNELPLWLAIAVKAIFAATVVVGAVTMAERSGPLVAGLIIAMPISIGPAYVMLGLTATPQFIADSALRSVAANAAVAVFGVVYVLLARRLPMSVSLLLALVSWFATAALERAWNPGAWTVVTVSTLGLLAGSRLMRPAASARKSLAGAKRWYDLPLRAVFVGVFVAILVTVSNAIGPQWTGLLAAFPLVLTSSIILLHPRVGATATAAVLATAIEGIVIYPLALLVVHRYSVAWGTWWSLGAGLAAILAWTLLVFAVRKSRAAKPG